MRTLEEMLDLVNGSSPEVEKTAAVAQVDLVDRLRKAAADDSPTADLRAEAARELAEKTAEISVIALTLAEIDQALAGGEKTASVPEPSPEHQKAAAFIKMALEQGHSEEDIATFIKDAAIIGNFGARAAGAVRRAIGNPLSRTVGAMGESNLRSEAAILRNVHQTGDPAKMHAAIERLRKIYPADAAMNFIRHSGIDIKEHPAYKDLLRMQPKGAASAAGEGVKKHHVGVEIGGKTYGVSKETAEKARLPAAVVGGAAAGKMLGGRRDEHKGRGPVIITG